MSAMTSSRGKGGALERPVSRREREAGTTAAPLYCLQTSPGNVMNNSAVEQSLAANLRRVEGRLSAACARAGRRREEVTLVAVTKTASVEVAALLPRLGVPDLGESRPQELWRKAAAIPQAR